jgi:hypothetical protein
MGTPECGSKTVALIRGWEFLYHLSERGHCTSYLVKNDVLVRYHTAPDGCRWAMLVDITVDFLYHDRCLDCYWLKPDMLKYPGMEVKFWARMQ